MIYDIVQGTNRARAKVISVNDLQNFYPEIEDTGKSKNIKALIGCPGYRLAATGYGSGNGRGCYTTSTGRFFKVVYNRLVEMSTSETVTIRGILNTSTGMCGIADNGTQILIVDGTHGYIYNLSTNTLTRIADADFPEKPTHCLFTDGYFLVNKGGSGQFYFSASYDGTSWDGLDFATAEYSADTLQGIVKTSNGTVWMIGTQTVEMWSNTGNADLPWRRISGAVKVVGCIAPYSIATDGEKIFFLGNGSAGYGSIYMGAGYDVQKISTPAIEYQVKQLTGGLESAVGFMYSDESHSFYVISFTSEVTFVYDISTGEWHTRGSLNAVTGQNIRQFAQGYAFFNGKHYVGSFLDGNIYEMNLNLLDEAGTEIRRVIVTGHLQNENRNLAHLKLEIECEKGVGLVGEAEPQIMIHFSDDNANTWSSEFWVGVGKIGEYLARAIRRQLGRSRDRVYRIVCTDKVKWVIVNAYVDVL